MLYDKITLSYDDIALLSVLVDNQLKLDNKSLSFFGPAHQHYKEALRLHKEISLLSDLLNKLKSINSITYN